MDDTGSRVNDKNHYTHVLCNDFFTAYFTCRKKDRLILLELLCRDQLKFMFNQEAHELMVEFGFAKKWLDQIKPMLHAQPLTREAIDSLLETLFLNPKKHSTNRRTILESAALAYYQHSKYFIHYLMTDNSPSLISWPYIMRCAGSMKANCFDSFKDIQLCIVHYDRRPLFWRTSAGIALLRLFRAHLYWKERSISGSF